MTAPQSILRQEGLIVRRKQRIDETAWQSANSWLGGLPTIALEDWPRHRRTRMPLTHLAQIDFSDFPTGPWSQYVPASGALCFFIDPEALDTDETATVIYVADPQNAAPCQPPADHPPIGGEFGWKYERVNYGCTRIDDARRAMPRWPLDLVPVRCSEGSDGFPVGTDFDPPIQTVLGPSPGFDPTPHQLDQIFQPVCRDDEVPWGAARRVTVAVAHHAGFNPQFDVPPGFGAKLKDQWWDAPRRHAAIQGFLDRWADRIAAQDPYALMPALQVKSFDDEVSALRKKGVFSKRFYTYQLKLSDAGSVFYRDMMLGPRDLYEKIPPQVRSRIDNEHRYTGWKAKGAHQIFGIGLDIQGELARFDDDLLLFQVTWDEMMDWRWGDLGVYQFFISPEHLASRTWVGIVCAYTCG